MTDEAKALAERLRQVAKVLYYEMLRSTDSETVGQAFHLIETQARENAAKDAEIERLRGLLVRGYVVCDGDDEDAVAFRNDAHAALAGGPND